MAFAPAKRTKDLLMWMLSTKMMPPVGALIPVYLIFRDFGLLDTRGGLIAVLFLLNLPIVVWMLYTYFKEIPGEILEAARMDGASLWKEICLCTHPDGGAGNCLDLAIELHPGLERVVLDAQSDDGRCRPTHPVHRVLFKP